jgi:nucleotide-binding universal stress UspA family protein
MDERLITHLLVPLDGSEVSERAMRNSVALARQLGARITAFVAEPTAPVSSVGTTALAIAREQELHQARTERHARELLLRFEATARAAGVAFAGHHTCTEQIDEAIVGAAAAHGCDMIVMVTHDRGRLARLLRRSNTAAVMSRSKLPLLVLH